MRYKAVSKIRNRFYSLGMGPAQVVHLPKGRWISGGKHGFTVSPRRTSAAEVIRIANGRKVIPIPENMKVIPVEARGFRWGNGWREVYDFIKISVRQK